jgi:hypothetical protein
MPKQIIPRILYQDSKPDLVERPKILVIDDNPYSYSVTGVIDYVLDGNEYIYTNSIRCHFDVGRVLEDDQEIAIARCAVWTNALLADRLVILSTVNGLKQMKIDPDKKPGDMFRSKKLGLILCIPPLYSMLDAEYDLYAAKAMRLMKEARIVI